MRAASDAPPNAAPSLRPLLVCQFLMIFVGNALTLLVALLTAHEKTRLLREAGRFDPAAFDAARQEAIAYTFIISIVPMILASVPAAWLVDRWSKTTLMRDLSIVLTILMVIAAVAMFVAPTTLVPSLVVVGLVGAQGALFSPAKYGLIPELVDHARLSEANGRVELSTFIAIVGGSAVAGPLYWLSGSEPWIAMALLALLAAGSWWAACLLPQRGPVGIAEPLSASVAGAWKAIRGDSLLALAVWGSVAFWGLSKFIGQNVLVHAQGEMGLRELWASLPLAILAVGLGVGCALAGKLSARKVEMGLLPLGGLAMAASAILLGVHHWGRGASFVILGGIGLCGGLLLVPLNALLQWRAPADRRGGVVALSNVVVFAGMCAGASLAAFLAHLGLTTHALFIVAGTILLVGGVFATMRSPITFVRLVLFLLTHSVYRLRVHGRQHVPETGGALLVPNHVSFVDGLLVVASLDRPVRFLVDASFFERPLLGRALRMIGAIPISSVGGPRMILRAFREAGKHLDDGHLVCVFAEGQITRHGLMNPFRRGLERIVKGRSAPIIPVHLDGVWGSIFSYFGGRFVTKWPERFPHPVQVSFGAPLSPTSPIHEVRRAVMELGSEAWRERKASRLPLHHAFLGQVRRAPWRLLFADAETPMVSRLRAAVGAITLARALHPTLADAKHVGVLLPASVGAALSNLAIAFSGRASVNLNYTAGAASLESAARQAGLRHVLTTAAFLEKANVTLPPGVQPLFVDELLRGVAREERWISTLLALVAPKRWVDQACGAQRPVKPDDLVTILFSSGSTGEPKGVLLSHFNVDSNVAALAQSFHTTKADRILGILPLFHSFGYTATLWFPACQGLATVFHPSPIDAPAIGTLAEKHRVTFLLATPTLLSIYLRRLAPAHFGSLRLVLAGAEKLTETLANAFEDHFGIRPLEGYGATECAPLIAASTHDFRAPGFWQPGWRRGSVGQAAPGIALRVVDPETFALLPPGEQGLLLVRGPNVMEGYLGRPDLTAKALRDGWYVTGDLARVDEDGFLTITDRVARFSKIGGEMVPHGRIEEELHRAAGVDVPIFAVTALPDPRKGERLAVVHTFAQERVPELLAKLAAGGLPNLFLPRADHFVHVDALPLLGTGKLDLRTVKRLAEQALLVAAAE